jgi:hypothetical protein
MKFSSLEEIKAHCDQKFVGNTVFTVESQISETILGTNRNYSLKMNLNLPVGKEIENDIKAIKRDLEDIKAVISSSEFSVNTNYGPITRGTPGYHFEMSVKDKKK